MKKATIFIILLISIASANVYANSGSYSYEPVPGFHAVPLKSDKVEIQHEDLLFDASITGTPDIAFVTAKYTIKNISNEKEKLSTPIPYIGDYRKIDMANKTYAKSEVLLDGKKMTSQIRLIPELLVKLSDGNFVRNFLYAKDGQVISFMDIIKYLNSSVDINSNDAVKKIEEISRNSADNLPVYHSITPSMPICDFKTIFCKSTNLFD